MSTNSTTPSPTDGSVGNFTASADEFYQQLYVSVPVGLTLILIYCIIRRVCLNQCEIRRNDASSQYLAFDDNNNNDRNEDEKVNNKQPKYPQISRDSFIKWIYDIWMIDSNSFYEYAGFDALVFRLFLIGCFKICLLSLPYSLFILLPIYATSASDPNDDWLDKLSMNTIPAQDNRLYATLVASYLFTFIALYYLSNIYLKIAYVTDTYYIGTKKEKINKNIDELTWFNYNKRTMHDHKNSSLSINDISDIDLNKNNDNEEEEEEKNQHKLSMDFYGDITAPSIDRYTVMIRNIPKHLQNEQSFTEFIESLYGKDKINKVVIIPDVSALIKIDDEIKVHENALKQLSIKHNFKMEDIYNESNMPEIFGRMYCFGLCGNKMNLISYHRDKKDELISKLNRLKESYRLSLTNTGFVVFKYLEDVTAFVSAPKSLNLLMMEISKASPSTDIYWENLKFTSRDLFVRHFCITVSMVFLLLFWSIPVIAIQGLANLEQLFKTFHGDIHHYLSDSSISYLQGSLTVLVLDIFLLSVPIIVEYLTKLSKPTDRIQYQLSILSKYYICLLFMVLLVTVITSAILNGADNYEDYFKNFVNNIGNLANLLANGLSNMSIYFLLYLLLNTFIWIPLELYRIGYHISNKFGSQTPQELNHFIYSMWIPKILLIFTICLTYSVMNPLMWIFGLIYFLFSIIIFTYNLSMNYVQMFQIGPKLWLIIFDLIRYSFIISIITLYGLLLLKQSYICSVFELILLVIVWIFTGKMKTKFNEIFKSSALITAKYKDAQLKMNNLNIDPKELQNAYLAPVLRSSHKESQPYYQLQQ